MLSFLILKAFDDGSGPQEKSPQKKEPSSDEEKEMQVV
jgi:hypothetical protein